MFYQIHNKLQDVSNCLFSNTIYDLNDSLNTSIYNNYNNGTLITNNNSSTNSNNIYELNNDYFNRNNSYENDENLNIIHNSLVNNINFDKHPYGNNNNNQNIFSLYDDNDLFIIENSMNRKRIGLLSRQKTFSPGDNRLKHYF